LNAVNVSDLSVSIGTNIILKEVSLSVREGEIVLVTGPCGSGKTTLLKVLASIIPNIYTNFSITGSVKVFDLNPWQAAEKGLVAYVPQDIYTFFLGLRVCEELELLGLPLNGFVQHGDRFLEELSDGMLYKLLTCVVANSSAKLLLLDEPASHMDMETLTNVLELLRANAQEKRIAIVVAGHQAEWLRGRFDAIIELGNEVVGERKDLDTPSPRNFMRYCEQKFNAYATNLKINLGRRTLFKGLSLAVARGSVFGVFGRNGIGKTTLLKVLAGLLPYESGDVYVERPIFYIPQKPLYWFSTGSVCEELSLYIRLFGRRLKDEEVLEMFSLQHLANRNPYTLSVGEARRLAMALAYIASPKLLLFDEPFLGLDRESEEVFADLLESVKKRYGSVILASHNRILTKYVDNYLELSQRVSEGL